MAEVTVRLVTTISDRSGTTTVDWTENYQGQGAKLVEQVGDGLTAATVRAREVLGFKAGESE